VTERELTRHTLDSAEELLVIHQPQFSSGRPANE
jgi:hypothetical protein